VKASKLARNVDSPESGLDAIAQAMLCEDVIGWRNNKDSEIRKVIIVITDQEMHYAYDGLMGGIARPFDMKCHTNLTTMEYTEQLVLDYPSFGQVNIYFLNGRLIKVFFQFVKFICLTTNERTFQPSETWRCIEKE
jgi:hypothetical protein